MPTAIHKRALQRAIELAGGIDALSRRIGVPAGAIRFWAHVSSPLPDDIFLRIVDLLLEGSPTALQPPPTPRAPGEGKAGR